MKLDEIDFFQAIDLPDGRTTPGATDHRAQPAFLGIDRPGILQGQRVLDVGANDGFWSFWAERAGAQYVLATDVESYADYDWGYDKPAALPATDKRSAFEALRREFESKVVREKATVYDLAPEKHGTFDLVFLYGVLYHLRHPLLALDALRRVCKGCLIVETHVCNRHPFVPETLFYWDDVFDGKTNWTGPSEACVVAWLRSAGFNTIFRQRVDLGQYTVRQQFIGTLTDRWQEVFRSNRNFALCDAAYFARVRRETQYRLDHRRT